MGLIYKKAENGEDFCLSLSSKLWCNAHCSNFIKLIEATMGGCIYIEKAYNAKDLFFCPWALNCGASALSCEPIQCYNS